MLNLSCSKIYELFIFYIPTLYDHLRHFCSDSIRSVCALRTITSDIGYS